MSVFILEGNSLKAVLIVEGPFANPDVDSTTDLLAAEQKFVVDKYRWTKHTMNREVVNFEHLQLPEPEFEEDEEMIVPSLEGEEDDDTVREGEDMPALQARIEERRQRQQIARRKMQEARRKRAERLLEHRKENAAIVKNEGSPHQRTIKAGVDGWFRGCVSAEFNSVVLELEFRTTQELDGIDPETNHVYTYEKWQEMQEDTILNADKPENEPSIKVEDFIHTRNQIRELRRALGQISDMQRTSQNRMKRHAEIGEHSHSKMTQNSILVTILFMVISAFQVFTIQRWFSSNNASLLAR